MLCRRRELHGPTEPHRVGGVKLSRPAYDAPLAHAAIIAVRLAAPVSEIPDRSMLKP
jgi:hypothetical protein